jgi:hypothetical protein
MWAVDNKTPYGADRAWIRDKAGAHQWLVAVKATFDIGEQGPRALAWARSWGGLRGVALLEQEVQ